MARSKSARKAVANGKAAGRTNAAGRSKYEVGDGDSAAAIAGGATRPSRRSRRIPRALDEAIEAERSVLMKADAVLNCLALAMDYDDGSNIPRPYYAIIVELARDLVNDSIGRLETRSLEAHLCLPRKARANPA